MLVDEQMPTAVQESPMATTAQPEGGGVYAPADRIVHVPVRVEVPMPVPVPQIHYVDCPVPVYVDRPCPIPVVVDRPCPVYIDRPMSVFVERPIPMYIEQYFHDYIQQSLMGIFTIPGPMRRRLAALHMAMTTDSPQEEGPLLLLGPPPAVEETGDAPM